VLAVQDLETDCRVRALLVAVNSYTAEFDHAKATPLLLKFSKEYDCVINRPKDIFLLPAFFASLRKTKSLMKGKTRDDLLCIPRVTDPEKLAVMKILNALVTVVYFTDPMFVPLPIMLMMRWTLKHGVCAESCVAFAMYSYILAGPLGDAKGGFELTKVALELIDRLEAKERKSQTVFIVHVYTIHRYQPIHLSLRPLELAYKEGMTNGNIDFAYGCIYGLIACHYVRKTAKRARRRPQSILQSSK
jgi:predicted ATPase